MPLTLPEVQKYCSTLAEAGFLEGGCQGSRRLPCADLCDAGPTGAVPAQAGMRVPAVYDPNTAAFRILEKRVRP